MIESLSENKELKLLITTIQLIFNHKKYNNLQVLSIYINISSLYLFDKHNHYEDGMIMKKE